MTNDTLIVILHHLVYQSLTQDHTKFNYKNHVPRQKFNHYHLKPNLKSTFKCCICFSQLFLIY